MKTEEQIKNGKSRETGNIGYIRHKTKTNTTKTQHRKLRGQSRMENQERLATLGTQDENKQTKKTTQKT